jgi:hypothetical protein
MITMPNTSAEQPNSQFGSERGIAADVDGVEDPEAVAPAWEATAEASNAAVVRRRNEGEKKVEVRADG